MPTKKKIIFISALIYLSLFVGVGLLFLHVFPNREAIQTWISEQGIWGFLLYFGLATLATVFTPINYSMVGLVGGFLYGTAPAFFLLWAARVAGNAINFTIARKIGRRLLGYLVSNDGVEHYDRILQSEKALQFYFALCFLPFLPGDYGAYFLGFSKLKKRVFFPVTVLANLGSAFSLSYLGSGQGLHNPFFLTLFTMIFIGGLWWIHYEKKKFLLK